MTEEDKSSDCPAWEESGDSRRAKAQREKVLAQIILSDRKKLPSTAMVREWHRKLFQGIAPHEDYLGNFRDLDKVPKCVQYLEVIVNGKDPINGVPAADVLDEVDVFVSEFKDQVRQLDKMWRALKKRKTVFVVDRIVKLAAWAHGEWIRIHPFANGNGRTSRLWVNYVMARYGFEPLEIRPRPESPYGTATEHSMRYGDHRIMESVLWDLLWKNLKDRIEAIITSGSG